MHRTYAFVTDLQGKLMVFNVSGNILFSGTATSPYLPGTPLLRPVASLAFPRDPYDEFRPNVIDIEIDEAWAYCALGRSGIGIVNISNPLLPGLTEILETSGVTEGIAFRTDESGEKQMITGDLGAGMRLWGKALE